MRKELLHMADIFAVDCSNQILCALSLPPNILSHAADPSLPPTGCHLIVLLLLFSLLRSLLSSPLPCGSWMLNGWAERMRARAK